MSRQTILKCVVAMAVVCGVSGCNGPTKAGKEARAQANERMNIINAQVNYDQAKQAFLTGQFEKADREIKRAIARYSDAPTYHILHGRIFLEMHQLEASLDSFQIAIDLCESRIARAEEAEVDRKKSAPPDPSEKLPRSFVALGDDVLILAEAYYFTGIVYQRWSDDERAHQNYAAAFNLEPTNAQYLLAAAESLIALGDFNGAQALIAPKMAYFEHNAALRQLQAQIALLQGDPSRAVAIYNEARLLSPDDANLLEQLMWAQYASGQYGQCYESIKRLQDQLERQSGRISRRTVVNGRAFSTASGAPSAAMTRTDLQHLEARVLNLMGRTTEARELYIELTALRPSDPDVWTELGTLAWELGDYRRVAMCSVQLIALAPQRCEGYMLRGINERQKGNLEEAIRLFRQASERSPSLALPHLLLGQTLEQRGDTAGASVAYIAAMDAEPNSPEAAALLGRLTMQEVATAPVTGIGE